MVKAQAIGKRQRFLASFAIGNSTLTVPGLLYEEDAVWRFKGPKVKPVADAMIVFGQRFDGTHQADAIRLPGEFDLG